MGGYVGSDFENIEVTAVSEAGGESEYTFFW